MSERKYTLTVSSECAGELLRTEAILKAGDVLLSLDQELREADRQLKGNRGISRSRPLEINDVRRLLREIVIQKFSTKPEELGLSKIEDDGVRYE